MERRAGDDGVCFFSFLPFNHSGVAHRIFLQLLN
jgi:hypothetical protein